MPEPGPDAPTFTDPAEDFDALADSFDSFDSLEEEHDRFGGELDSDPTAPGNPLAARRLA